MKQFKLKTHLLLIIGLLTITACDSDDDMPSPSTAEELLLDKDWFDDAGGRLRFNTDRVFIDTDLSGTWSWEKSDAEPYIIKADYGSLDVWYEFTNVTETSLDFRISLTGPPEDYSFEGLDGLTSE